MCSVALCITHILYTANSIPLLLDIKDYIFYNNAIVLQGYYSAGELVCAVMNVSATEDNIVEGTEHLFTYLTEELFQIAIFIIDNDCE